MFLLHRLEERRLRLRGCPVDLVGENDVGEHRTSDELEVPCVCGGILFDDVGAGDIRRHQVGRELDALEGEVEHARERAHHERLRESRHADQQTVAIGQDGYQEFLDHRVLTDDDLLDLTEDPVTRSGKRLDGGDIVAGSDLVCHVTPLDGA